MKTKRSETPHGLRNGRAWAESITEMLARLDSDDPEIRDTAESEIQESPLSVEVRSGWTCPGHEMEAEEYMILLSTGGPALRIVGDIGQFNEPSTARLEWQDWGTPWAEVDEYDSESVLRFARIVGPCL